MMEKTLNNDQYNYWDIRIKAISTTLTVGTLIIGVFTFLCNQKKEIKQKELDYRKELSSTQRVYYSQMSDIIGDLSIFSETGDFDSAFYVKRKEFKKLYYGRMNIVESREVDSALTFFYNALEKRIDPNSSFDDTDFKNARYSVHKAFRSSLRKTGDINLDTLTK